MYTVRIRFLVAYRRKVPRTKHAAQVPHFFEPNGQLRVDLAFCQTPHNFYNVDRSDTMGHAASVFYRAPSRASRAFDVLDPLSLFK